MTPQIISFLCSFILMRFVKYFNDHRIHYQSTFSSTVMVMCIQTYEDQISRRSTNLRHTYKISHFSIESSTLKITILTMSICFWVLKGKYIDKESPAPTAMESTLKPPLHPLACLMKPLAWKRYTYNGNEAKWRARSENIEYGSVYEAFKKNVRTHIRK